MTKTTVTIRDVYEQIDKLRQDIEDNYVTKVEFTPVKMCVYGLITLIITAVATAIVAQVVRAL